MVHGGSLDHCLLRACFAVQRLIDGHAEPAVAFLRGRHIDNAGRAVFDPRKMWDAAEQNR